jgi:hypothetical protein
MINEGSFTSADSVPHQKRRHRGWPIISVLNSTFEWTGKSDRMAKGQSYPEKLLSLVLRRIYKRINEKEEERKED